MKHALLLAALLVAAPLPSLAQDVPGDAPEELSWELDVDTLRDALLFIGSLEPAEAGAENADAVRELQASLRQLEVALSMGPQGDDVLQTLQAIGASAQPISPAQLDAVQTAMLARVQSQGADPDEAVQSMAMLRMLAEQGGIFGGQASGDPLADLARLNGADPTEMAAAMELLSNIATNGEQGRPVGEDAAIAAEINRAASAFGAHPGQTGDARAAEDEVRRLLGGGDAKPSPRKD